MRTLVYNLLKHQESLDKLIEELREADKTTGLSRPYPQWDEVKDLPYLDACWNEAVRLHPPFSLPLERVAPSGGIVIQDRFFPEGTCIGMNPYVVNRHRPTFGEDADEWRPERWLVDDAAARKKLEASIMTVSITQSLNLENQLANSISKFGAGRRVCAGRYIAMLEIKKAVPAIFLNYKVSIREAEFHSTRRLMALVVQPY
jgi:cytochrome P450